MLALNSYENRVYQVGLDDGSNVVVKFYRTGRWTDGAILEKLAGALADNDIPVVSAIRPASGALLHQVQGCRSSIFPAQGESAFRL